MPGKSEIVRAVREALDNLEVVKPWTDTEGTRAVMTKLCGDWPRIRLQSRCGRRGTRLWRMALRRHLARIRAQAFPRRSVDRCALGCGVRMGQFRAHRRGLRKASPGSRRVPFDDLHRLQPGQIRGDRGAACREGLGVQRLPGLRMLGCWRPGKGVMTTGRSGISRLR